MAVHHGGKDGKAGTISIKCSSPNECKSKFYFDLKTERGSGATAWQIQKYDSEKKEWLNVSD